MVAVASARDRAPSVRVWQAANAARGLQSNAERTARVQQEVWAAEALLVVARSDEGVVAMALVEPGRQDDRAGEVVPGHGHVSMVFVAPHLWAAGSARC